MKAITLLILFIISISMYSKSDDAIQPQFPGGDTALTQYLSKTIVYPTEAIKQKWDEKTLVAFTINEDGSITNVHIIKSSCLNGYLPKKMVLTKKKWLFCLFLLIYLKQMFFTKVKCKRVDYIMVIILEI